MTKKPFKMLVLSMTGQCNYRCRYCYAAYHDTHALTPKLAIQAVKLVVERNLKQDKSITPFILQFSGGEPLLNLEGITAVIEYIEQEKIPAQLQIQTNGSLLTDEIAQYLYKHKVGIGISLDGRPKVNDRQRLTKAGASAALATVNGIEILKRNNIACGLTCVVTSENVDELEGIVEFAYFLGNVRRIGFDLLRNQGYGQHMLPPSAEAMRKAIKRVYAKAEVLARSFGYEINFSQQDKCKQLKDSYDKLLGFAHCSAMTGEALFADALGKLYACASFVDDERFYLGNVEDGIIQERAEAISQEVGQAMQFCSECKQLDKCGGGCLARWYQKDKFHAYESECALKLESN